MQEDVFGMETRFTTRFTTSSVVALNSHLITNKNMPLTFYHKYYYTLKFIK